MGGLRCTDMGKEGNCGGKAAGAYRLSNGQIIERR